MKKKLITGILAVTLAGLFCAQGFCENGASVSADEKLQQAIWDYKHENYEEALELLKPLRKEQPESTLIAYYLGITYKQLQDYNKARPNLEAAVAMKPRIKNALIELVDILYKKNDLDEAKKWIKVAEEENIHPAQMAFLKGLVLLKKGDDLDAAVESFERAKTLDGSLETTANYYIGLAHIKNQKLAKAKEVLGELVTQGPNTGLAVFADQYIDLIEDKEYITRPFRGHIGFACQYDDNVVLKPGATTLAADIGNQGDWRQVYTGHAEYNMKPVNHFGAKLGYAFYVGKQLDLGFYDMVSHLFYGQPGFYFDNAAITFPCNYNYVTVNDKHYLNSAQASNLNNIRLGKNQMLQCAFTYKWEDFIWQPTGPNECRDSNEYAAQLGWYCFFGKNKGIAQMKYTVNFDDTRGDNWRYFGNKFTMGATVPLMENVRLGSTVDFFFEKFVKTHSVYNKKREDSVLTVYNFVNIEVMKNTEIILSYTFVNDVCNLSVYKYKRNVYSVGAIYKF